MISMVVVNARCGSYSFQPTVPKIAIRLEIGSLRPFIPCIDEDYAISLLALLMRYRAAQPKTKVGRRRTLKDVSAPSHPRGIVPTQHHASMASPFNFTTRHRKAGGYRAIVVVYLAMNLIF